MKNKLFVVALLVISASGFFVFKNQKESAPQTSPAPAIDLINRYVRPHSPQFGNHMGRTTVIEWLDPECEACAMMHPIFKKIIAEYKDRVLFVIRYMPYHGNSMYAASALEEARELGKFEEAMSLLYEKLPEWGDHHNPRPELIVKFLGQLGIPADKLEKEYLIKKHGDKIKIDEEDGKIVGVRGTPTFFVNGQILRGLNEAALRAAIEEGLK